MRLIYEFRKRSNEKIIANFAELYYDTTVSRKLAAIGVGPLQRRLFNAVFGAGLSCITTGPKTVSINIRLKNVEPSSCFDKKAKGSGRAVALPYDLKS